MRDCEQQQQQEAAAKTAAMAAARAEVGGRALLVDVHHVPEPLWNMLHYSFGWLWWGVARPSDVVIITIIVRGRERVLKQWLCTVGKGGGDWFESES